MSQEEYDRAPATLKVRELQAAGKILVTTFLCPKEAPKNRLKILYRSRWTRQRRHPEKRAPEEAALIGQGSCVTVAP
jgi:hypothetical protein